ncbi:MAG: tungstate ABC transporter substrate-binding protein WtpA [Candidatus Helarchaeota archaeon]|nr:tungstate ABC transporter substrate-binding protein WtpA [Candidatus Helarchaeota archaeon]
MAKLKLSFWELHKNKIYAVALIAIIGVSIGASLWTISQHEGKIKLQVFHAGSLTVPFAEFAAAWMAMHPDYIIDNEGYGSASAIRQITELGRDADLLGSADYTLIYPMMMNVTMPDSGGLQYADWYIIFAMNEMGIAYIPEKDPPYLENLTGGDNKWFEILNRTDVTFGRADPWQDPCGYRTLMVWGLADDHYNLSGTADPQDINQSMYAKDPIMGYSGPGVTKIRGKEVDLISLLEMGEIDYLFIYKSIAVQHGLGYLELNDYVDLSNFTLDSFYQGVTVHRISPIVIGASSPDKTGQTIQYGVTIPNNAPHRENAIEYLKFILGYPGLLQELGQPPYYPAYASNISKLPTELQPYCVDYPFAQPYEK